MIATIVAAVLAQGTVGTENGVELMVMTEVSTRSAKPGAPVKLRLNKPLQLGDETIPVGAPAFGVVEQIKSSGVALRRGSLAVRITHLEHDGRTIKLMGDVDVRARGGKNDDLAKIILVPFYAPFAQGNSAKLKAGELLYAQLAEPAPDSASTVAPDEQPASDTAAVSPQ